MAGAVPFWMSAGPVILPRGHKGIMMATQYNIKQGATAYSPDGARDWGTVPNDKRTDVTPGGVLGDKTVISYPYWDESREKKFSVKTNDIVAVTVGDPDDDPPPDGETITWPSKTMQLRNTVTWEVWQNEDPVILTRSNG